ncbi:sulfotransferase [Paracoccaceae bacterium Fryx2]|nr:sulfotransferase [Paracoccaceae bacterium Fryx2]
MKKGRDRGLPPDDPRLAAPALAGIVSDALSLLSEYASADGLRPMSNRVSDPLPSLLDECRALCGPGAASRAPVRLLLHQACTGGSLIAKCLAAMPGTTLLSEMDPLSENHLQISQVAMYAPTDLIKQLRYSRHPADPELYVEIFLAGLAVLQDRLDRQGRRLVIRCHPHSQFFTAIDPASRPGVTEMIARQHPVRAALTVRHPLDSWLSLNNNQWVQFTPPTLEEYARRYLAFLDAVATQEGGNPPPIRYEDFVADPEGVLQDLCALLDLPFVPGTPDLIAVIRVSGDSGRSDAVIGPRPRRAVPQDMLDAIAASPAYHDLCDRLGYDAAP